MYAAMKSNYMLMLKNLDNERSADQSVMHSGVYIRFVSYTCVTEYVIRLHLHKLFKL